MKTPEIVILTVVIALNFGHGLMFAPESTYFPELFGPNVRYSGASFGFQVSAAIGGGFAPIIATALAAYTGGTAGVSIMLILLALVTLVATLFARETKDEALLLNSSIPGRKPRWRKRCLQSRSHASRTRWSGGRLLHIHIAPAASFEMEEIAEANFVAGRGIEGDRYFLGTGTYSPKPDFREVTLFEIEVLEALGAQRSAVASPVRSSSNRPTIAAISPCCGVPLNHLVGKRFRVGERRPVRRTAQFPLQISRGIARPAGLSAAV